MDSEPKKKQLADRLTEKAAKYNASAECEEKCADDTPERSIRTAGVLRYNREPDEHEIISSTSPPECPPEFPLKCEYCEGEAMPSLDLTQEENQETVPVFCCAQRQRLYEALAKQRYVVEKSGHLNMGRPEVEEDEPNTELYELLFKGKEKDLLQFVLDLSDAPGEESEEVVEEEPVPEPEPEPPAPPEPEPEPEPVEVPCPDTTEKEEPPPPPPPPPSPPPPPPPPPPVVQPVKPEPREEKPKPPPVVKKEEPKEEPRVVEEPKEETPVIEPEEPPVPEKVEEVVEIIPEIPKEPEVVEEVPPPPPTPEPPEEPRPVTPPKPPTPEVVDEPEEDLKEEEEEPQEPPCEELRHFGMSYDQPGNEIPGRSIRAVGLLRYNRESDHNKLNSSTIPPESPSEHPVKCEYCEGEARPSLDLTQEDLEVVPDFCCAQRQNLCEILVQERWLVEGSGQQGAGGLKTQEDKATTKLEQLPSQDKEQGDHMKIP